MRWLPSAPVAVLCLGLASPPGGTAIHYERPPCGHDEVQAEVLDGVSGYVCTPKCAENTYDCPSDVPDFAAAQAQCMLKDVDGFAYCALLCSVDTQCPNGARCQRLQQAGVGMCMYPLSFTDWVRQGSSRKLSYGLPQRKDRQIPSGIVQKAIAAVQNLKFKYGIQDGDTDVVTVKEFLSSLPGSSGAVGPTAAQGTGTLSAGMYSGSIGPSQPVVSSQVVASSPSQESRSEFDRTIGAYRHDWSLAKELVREGLPGLEQDVGASIWQAEHLGNRGNAQTLLRHLIEIALIYLALGALYKNQVLGASGMDMIPHISFWMEYPQLVMDGVNYAKLFLTGSAGGGNFGGGFEPLGRAERDTFAQFEPSK
mmetsp:Transcript_117393/g.191088  ORF Transcript_117393/g.191088 Transcript_117393/m.191088 type:complete len:367 (-) Transcript_117393:73-1173(-)